MRKADYLILADIFRRQHQTARTQSANARTPENAAFNEGKAAALETAADCFARENRTINRAAFLLACGLKP